MYVFVLKSKSIRRFFLDLPTPSNKHMHCNNDELKVGVNQMK